ncbi:serine hydrolase [Streptosporangium minutum]|uniref:serine hydrolase n=1 Tax=Streptosporangium minutum TaxID=569862 RepID=UPI001F611224|nr:serine hydrolase domain-containing protein [Streptosporangium minutum]
MSFPRLRLPLVISLFVLAVLLGWSAPAHATGERLVDDYRSVYGTPGVAAAVIDGSSVETTVGGRDGDGNAVTPRTRFRTAPLSKSMTATAIMLLTDRFSPDDPVIKVLPEFKTADPRYTKITVRASS